MWVNLTLGLCQVESIENGVYNLQENPSLMLILVGSKSRVRRMIYSRKKLIIGYLDE